MQKLVIFLLLCALPLLASSQVKPVPRAAKTPTVSAKAVKPKENRYTRWSAKAGGNISVVYLARNIKDKNNAPGYCGGINYEINNFLRVASLYTYFRPINIEPTWLDVNATTTELNLEMVAHFPNNKTLLYPFVGVSYNTYNGFFTGELDYLNLKEYYKVNSVVRNRWVGLNLGTGMEHNFGLIGVFVDYRMRVGKQEDANGVNIMDVCYTGGLKVRFPYGKGAKKMSSIFRTRDRFNLQPTN